MLSISEKILDFNILPTYANHMQISCTILLMLIVIHNLRWVITRWEGWDEEMVDFFHFWPYNATCGSTGAKQEPKRIHPTACTLWRPLKQNKVHYSHVVCLLVGGALQGHLCEKMRILFQFSV